MNRAEQVQSLFEQALELETADRESLLHGIEDQSLAGEVRGLLEALSAAGGFLCESPRPVDELAGTMIDRYRLVEQIGEGGFGVVWRAEQAEPLRRDVALKIIKLGADTGRVAARFEHERQALARMQHPNIAAMFDAGTTASGRPYFVMELVAGEPITKFALRHGLGIEDRVALVRDVCMAVQHAHLKGLVHRDLKPANILVSGSPEAPQPKIIDFGIAKAIDLEGRRGMTLTGDGQLVGTLEYMAPEQADGAVADVDSRADVYSIGIVLFELLSGRRPFELRDTRTGAVGMIERILHEEAPRPSAVVAGQTSCLVLEGADSRRWARRVQVDLDWIVRRALAKSPDDRYPTPNAMAADLERCLAGLPVEAGPPTTSYRLRRFVARHAVAVFAASVALVSLIAGTIGTALALEEARTANTAARVELDARRAALEATRRLLAAFDPRQRASPKMSMRLMLDEFAESLESEFGTFPAVARDLHLTVGSVYTRLGDLVEAEPHLRRAVELSEAGYGKHSKEWVEAAVQWSAFEQKRGREVESTRWAEAAYEHREVAPPELQRIVTLTLARLASYGRQTERSQRLAADVRAALDALPDSRDKALQLADCIEVQASNAWRLGEMKESLALSERVLELRRENLPAMSVDLVTSLGNVAETRAMCGDLAGGEAAVQEAYEITRLVYGEDHLEAALKLEHLASFKRRAGNLAEAREMLERTLAIRTRVLPANDPMRSRSLVALALLEVAEGELDSAEKRLLEALELHPEERVSVGQTFRRAAIHQNLAVVKLRRQDFVTAEHHAREAVRLHRESGGQSFPATADALQNIGLALSGQGDFAGALAAYEEALTLRCEHQPELWDKQRQGWIGLAKCHRELGQWAEAAKATVQQFELRRKEAPEDYDLQARLQLRVARDWLEAGAASEALAAAELSMATFEAAGTLTTEVRRAVLEVMLNAHEALETAAPDGATAVDNRRESERLRGMLTELGGR